MTYVIYINNTIEIEVFEEKIESGKTKNRKYFGIWGILCNKLLF